MKKQHVETMHIFARLMENQSGHEKQKLHDEQVHEAPVTSDEVKNPASSISQDLRGAVDNVVHVEVGLQEDHSSTSGQGGDYGLYGESANTRKSKILHTHDEDGSARLGGKKSVSGLSTGG